MITIFKKELKSYLRRGTGLFFASVLLFSVGFFAFVYNFNYGYSGVEIILPILSRVLVLALPFITMSVFAKDRDNGGDKLLYSLPFKSSQIVLGKFAALLCFFGIEVAFTALLPVIFGFFGTVNYLASYFAILGFFLFGVAMLALFVFIAAALKSKFVTVMVSYASIIVAFLLYIVPTGATSGVWMTAAKTIRFLSPLSQLDDFSIGVVKLTSFLYFIILTALFLFLAIRAEDKRRTKLAYGKDAPETKRFPLRVALAIILCVCTVAANVGISFIPSRFSTIDATESDSITLSKSTKDFLASLNCNVDIYIINADGSDRQFEYLVERYGEYSSKVTVHYVYESDIKSKLMALGWDGVSALDPYLVLIESDLGRSEIFTTDSAYFYNNPELGDMSESDFSEYYNALQQYAKAYPDAYGEYFKNFVATTKQYENIEQQLTLSIEYTAFEVIPGAYYLTGHGEPTIDKSNLYYFLSTVGFPLKGSLDLSSADSVPEDLCTLIINAPTSDLSNSEAKLISDYLANGGAMTIITNEANLDMPNLMSILEDYGVSAEKGAVSFDYKAAAEKAAAESESTKADTDKEVEYPDNNLVEATISTSHESLSAIASYGYAVPLLNANSIKTASDLRASVTVTPLLTTDKECFIEGVENSTGAKTVAVFVEEIKGDKVTEISWYTGAEYFDGENLQTLNAYVATYSVLWTIKNPTSTVGEIAPNPVGENYLTMSAAAFYILLVIMIVLLPCALVITGAVIRSKYKKNPFAPKVKAPKENPEGEENEEYDEEEYTDEEDEDTEEKTEE